MNIRELEDGDITISLKTTRRFRSFLQTCETLCVAGCCGLDAYNFSPLNIAFYLELGRVKMTVEENVQHIVDDISLVIDEARKHTPNERGEVAFIPEMNATFTWVELTALMDMLKNNLSLASQVVTYADQLTDVQLMREIDWGDGRVHASDRIIIPMCRLSFSSGQTYVAITVISTPDDEGWCNLRVSIQMKDRDWVSWKSPAYPCITFSELKVLSDFFNSVEEIDQTSDSFNSVDHTYQTRDISFTKPELAFQYDGVHFDIILSDKFLPPWTDKSEDEFIVTLPCKKRLGVNNHNRLEEYMLAVDLE